MSKIRLRPSKKFRALITLEGSLNAAAIKWGVPYMTISDWLAGNCQLPGDQIAKIVERTGHTYEDLFEHVGRGKGKR